MIHESSERGYPIRELGAAFPNSIRIRFAPILPAIIRIKKTMNTVKTIATISLGQISPALFQIAALIEDAAQPQFFLPEIFKPAPDLNEADTAKISKLEAIKTGSGANKTAGANANGIFDRPAPRKKGAKSKGENEAAYSISRLTTAEFHFKAPSAKSVKLAADFTDWEKYPLDMIKGRDGVWFTFVPLAPGNYSYRFIVDGKWRDDPHSVKRVPNPFGTANAVMSVS